MRNNFTSLNQVFDDFFDHLPTVFRVDASCHTGGDVDTGRYNTGGWQLQRSTAPHTGIIDSFPYPDIDYRDRPSFNPTGIDDLIEFLKKQGAGGPAIDVFEKAKRVYKDLPSFPATDVSVDEENGDLHFDIALPGYDEEDIDISFENDTMTVGVCKDNALSKYKKEDNQSRVYIRNGLKSGKVEFKVPVPSTRFKIKEAAASYKNGLLSIVVPRQEEHAPHKLKLTGE